MSTESVPNHETLPGSHVPTDTLVPVDCLPSVYAIAAGQSLDEISRKMLSQDVVLLQTESYTGTHEPDDLVTALVTGFQGVRPVLELLCDALDCNVRFARACIHGDDDVLL